MGKRWRFQVPPNILEFDIVEKPPEELDTFREETFSTLRLSGWEPRCGLAMQKTVESREFRSMRIVVARFDCCCGTVHLRSEPEPVWFRTPIEMIHEMLADKNHALKPVRIFLESGRFHVAERRRFDEAADFRTSKDVARWFERRSFVIAQQAIEFSRMVRVNRL